MSAVIDRVVATARTLDDVDEVALHSAMAGIKTKRDRLYGVELASHEILDKQLGELARDAKRVETWKEIALPVVDENVLTWRSGASNGIPLPVLALTSLNAPETGFQCKGRWVGDDFFTDAPELWPSPFAPPHLARLYGDVFTEIERVAKKKRGNVTMTTSYHGVIPDEAKDKIAASPFEPHETHLLREVKKEDWTVKIKEQPRPPRPARHWDPLVVGIRDASMWLITVFDPTPVEQYVAEEFALLAGTSPPQLMPGKN